jgi:hypothetical protein
MQLQDSKYQSQMRQLGKKVFQMREAVDMGTAAVAVSGGSQSVALVAKQAIGLTTTVRQVLGSMPSDAFMLAMHPFEKIYSNPVVVPTEVLTLEQNTTHNEFYEAMEQHAQMCVIELSEQQQSGDGASAGQTGQQAAKREVPEKILETLFGCTSAKRMAVH